MENPLDENVLTMIFARLRMDRKLYESIYKSPIRDLGEFYERAAKEVRWEETFGSKKPSNQKDRGGSSNQGQKKDSDDSYKREMGGTLTIRSPRRQEANMEVSDLRVKVVMRTTIPYLTPKIGFSPLRGTKKILGGPTP